MGKQWQAVHKVIGGGKHNCTKEKGKAMTNIYIYIIYKYIKVEGGGGVCYILLKKGKKLQ